MPDAPLSPVTLALIAPRRDGTRVAVDDVVRVLRDAGVAAAVVDGADEGHPGMLSVNLAADDQGHVAPWGVGERQPRHLAQLATLLAAELRTPVVDILEHSTVALLPDGTEIETDEHDPDPDRAAIVAAVQGRAGSRAVHAYASDEPIPAMAVAKAFGQELPMTVVGGWTVVRTPDDTERTEEPGVVSKRQRVAVRAERNGIEQIVRGLLLTDAGKVEFVAVCPVTPTRVHDDYPDEVLDLIDPRVTLQVAGRAIDPDLAEVLSTAADDPSGFFRTVLGALGAPDEVVRWAEGGEPGPDAGVARPKGLLGMVRAGMAAERQGRRRRGERR